MVMLSLSWLVVLVVRVVVDVLFGGPSNTSLSWLVVRGVVDVVVVVVVVVVLLVCRRVIAY